MNRNFVVVFTDKDPAPREEIIGQLKIKLDSVQPMKSHIEIPYSNEHNGTTFTCTGASDGSTHTRPSHSTVTYELAGTCYIIATNKGVLEVHGKPCRKTASTS